MSHDVVWAWEYIVTVAAVFGLSAMALYLRHRKG